MRRDQRNSNFRIFFHHAREDFSKIVKQDLRHANFERVYGFGIVPGGRDGGLDKRVVEVYYGNRPFESITEMTNKSITGVELDFPTVRRRLLTEQGAELSYQRTDSGIIICTLWPAKTEGFNRKEDAIILDWIANSNSITGLPKLQYHWRSFMSYMQCTSLDGDPSISDRIRVCWLLFTKRIVVSGRMEERKFLTAFGSILYFSLSVGLGGFLIELFKRIYSFH